MKDMFLKKSDIYHSKWATVVQKFQLSMTKLGNHDEIRWFDGIWKNNDNASRNDWLDEWTNQEMSRKNQRKNEIKLTRPQSEDLKVIT